MMGRPDGFRYPGMLDSDSARGIIRAVALAVSPLMEAGYPPVLLCSNEARPILKALTRTDLPRLVVLAQAEIPRDTSVQVLGTVATDELERTECPAPVASSLV
jgi:flagellar biosynthesis protein FlhA